VDYNVQEDEPSGSLKIVVLDETLSNRPDQGLCPDNGGFQSNGITLDVQDKFRSLYWTITQTNTSEFPVLWKRAINRFLVWKYGNTNPHAWGTNIWNCQTPESRLVVKYAKEFYDTLKDAMPALMAYRYQNQILAQYTNSLGKSVVDYEDEENTIVAKALPIMDVEHLQDTFSTSFKNGNFSGGKQFSYSHCIVDLNPDLNKYNKQGETRDEFNVQDTQFPMKFASGVNVNVDDYKTSKLVLTRIDRISGEKFDTFTMGSHATDYDLIADTRKRKYKDDESIVDGAIDDYAEITLGNGGSCQKKYVNNDLNGDEHPDGYAQENDLYYANTETSTPSDARQIVKRNPETGDIVDPEAYAAKYFKNKHFFLDPFTLTIAQWCYVKLNSQRTDKDDVPTQEKARELLRQEEHLAEIEESYWKYLQTWEKDEWR